jgi:hypothetical protein
MPNPQTRCVGTADILNVKVGWAYSYHYTCRYRGPPYKVINSAGPSPKLSELVVKLKVRIIANTKYT